MVRSAASLHDSHPPTSFGAPCVGFVALCMSFIGSCVGFVVPQCVALGAGTGPPRRRCVQCPQRRGGDPRARPPCAPWFACVIAISRNFRLAAAKSSLYNAGEQEVPHGDN